MNKLKYQFYIFQIFLSFVLILFLGLTYYFYENQYKKEIDAHIQSEIELYQKDILSSIVAAAEKLKKQRAFFQSIHHDALEILRKNPNYDLQKLKNEIKLRSLTSYIDVELYLLNKNYIIYKTTYPKDLGFNLSIVTEAKNYLDKTSKDGKIYVSDIVSTDALDMKYKLYTYSKLDDSRYFEMGFIDTTLTNLMESVLKANRKSSTQVNLYNVSKDKRQYYYYHMQEKNNVKSKEEQYKKFKKFSLNEITDDPIIRVIKSDKVIYTEHNGIYTVYTRIFHKDMFPVIGFEDIVMKLNIDVNEQLEFLKSLKGLFFISLFVIVSLLLMFFLFVKNKFTNPIESISEAIAQNKKVTDTEVLSLNNELTEISLKYNALYDKLSDEIALNKSLLLVDPLTHAYNRKAFDDALKNLFSLYKRYQIPFSLILLDIDDFKEINDNYGHLAGDQVLIGLVKIIKKHIRDTDSLYRVGGEEFVIICKNTTKEDALRVAQKVRREVENSSLITEKKITLSIGVTEVQVQDDKDSIYKRVDENLYTSKNNGKNRVTAD